MKKTLRLTALIIAASVIFTSLCVGGVAARYDVVSGIEKISANTSSEYNQYSTHWQYWCQGASKYSKMRSSGCRITAQAKLLVESGIAPSDTAVFNPDIYYDWGYDNGVFSSTVAETGSHGASVTKYAASVGKKLVYEGRVTLSGNDYEDAATVMAYINSGYYVIAASSGHQQYIGRAASLAAGKAVVLDSWVSWSQSPYSCYDMATGMSGVDMTYSYMLYFSADNNGSDDNNNGDNNGETVEPSAVSVEFYDVTDADFASDDPPPAVPYVGATDAVIVKKAVKPSGVDVDSIGIILYDSNGNVLAKKSDTSDENAAASYFYVCYNLSSVLEAPLTPRTDYSYRLFATVNGKTFESPLFGLSTPNAYTLYFDSMGGTAVEPLTVSVGEIYKSLPVPVRNGYAFDGWYISETGGEKVEEGDSFTGAYQTLYAHWIPVGISDISIEALPLKTSYITGEGLDTEGLTLSVTTVDGSTETVSTGFTCYPAVFSYSGEQTVTVTYAGKTATFTVNVTEASEIKLYRAEFIVDSLIYYEQTYRAGDVITVPLSPEKEGHRFVCWSPEVPEAMPEQDLSFVAVFEEVSEPPVQPKPTVNIRTPSVTEIEHGDYIILHADVENLPAGATVLWYADNGNFKMTASDDGKTCVITPESKGVTVFTAKVTDENGEILAEDTQAMTSESGFFKKIIAFFRRIFGLTKVIPQLFSL